MGTDIAVMATRLKHVEEQASAARPLLAAVGQGQITMMQTLQLADAMDKMRTALSDDIVAFIKKQFENKAVGFVTDEPKEGYPLHVLKEVLLEAALHGMYPANNEFNVIKGRFYAAKNGLRRKVKTFDGLTDLRVEIGIPTNVGDNGTLVPIKASWRLRGVHDEADYWDDDKRIAVKRNKDMGVDAVIGKAERKLYARILDRITGMTFSDGDEEVASPIDVQPLPAPPPEPAPQVDAQGEFLFSGMGDEKFLAKVQAADTLEIVSALREEYLAHCQCDEDRMFVVKTCTARAHELRSGAASAPSTKE